MLGALKEWAPQMIFAKNGLLNASGVEVRAG